MERFESHLIEFDEREKTVYETHVSELNKSLTKLKEDLVFRID